MEPTFPDPRVPERIGRYTDLHILGRGGMGAVYRAYDPELDRPVAIKVMLHSTPDFIARFRREAQSIARLTHGNVVQVFDFGVDEGDGNPYFVMELVEGTPLDQLLRERGRLPAAEAIDIAQKAAQGLSAAHRAGIIHRDIKPSNLIVDSRGGVKIVDFGIARASSGAQLTTAASLMGTPGYMSPEQAQGKSVDHRADIYALGLTLFEMVAGEPPFYAEDPIALVVMNMQEPLPDLRQRGLGLPEDLITLIEQMAKKSPDERLQSCDAVVRALEAIAADAPVALPSMARGVSTDSGALSVPPTHIRPIDGLVTARHRGGFALAVGAALAVSGIGVAVVVMKRPPVMAPQHDPQPSLPVQPLAKTPDPTPKATPPSSGDAVPEKAGAALPATTELAQRPVVDHGPLRVAFLKFQNLGKDPALEALSIGIGETAVSDLVGIAEDRVRFIERSDIDSDIGEIDRGKDEHFDKALVAQAGKLVGVHVVVQGGFQRAGNTVRITARFVRVQTGEIIDTVRIDGRARKVLDLQDEITKKLRERLLVLVEHERPASQAAEPPKGSPR